MKNQRLCIAGQGRHIWYEEDYDVGKKTSLGEINQECSLALFKFEKSVSVNEVAENWVREKEYWQY